MTVQTMFFIIACDNNGKPIPIMAHNEDENAENIALYETFDDAWNIAVEQPLCKSFGFRIIAWPGIAIESRDIRPADLFERLDRIIEEQHGQ